MEIFQRTPLGIFLARRRPDERQELLQCYLRDFLLLTVRVSTWQELEVRAEAGPDGGQDTPQPTLAPSVEGFWNVVKSSSFLGAASLQRLGVSRGGLGIN